MHQNIIARLRTSELQTFIHPHLLFLASILSVNPALYFNFTPCFKTHIGGVPRWNNEIRGISFITDFAILFQSPLFTRAARGPEIQADQSSYQLTPCPLLFLPSLLSSSVLSLCFTTVSRGHYYLCFASLFLLSYSIVKFNILCSPTFTFHLVFLLLHSQSLFANIHSL